MQYGQTADTPTRIAWIAFLLFTPMLKVAVPISLGEFQAEGQNGGGRGPSPEPIGVS